MRAFQGVRFLHAVKNYGNWLLLPQAPVPFCIFALKTTSGFRIVGVEMISDYDTAILHQPVMSQNACHW